MSPTRALSHQILTPNPARAHERTQTHAELMEEKKEKLSKGLTPRIMSGSPRRLLEACQVGEDSKENRRGDKTRCYIPVCRGR